MTMRTPNARRSTSSPAVNSFATWCLRRLDGGALLNLGSGYGALGVVPGDVFNADHSCRVLAEASLPAACDAGSLPYRDAAFTGALVKDLLEHVQDPVAVLVEVYRVLQLGGRVIVTVPRAIPRAVWADPTHVRGFTSRAIVECLSDAGFACTLRPRRCGAVPGAGRFPVLLNRILLVCAVPGLGHWLGTNWYVEATKAGPYPTTDAASAGQSRSPG